MQISRLPTAWMKIIQVIFKPRVSFLLNLASPFSVMTHSSNEMF